MQSLKLMLKMSILDFSEEFLFLFIVYFQLLEWIFDNCLVWTMSAFGTFGPWFVYIMIAIYRVRLSQGLILCPVKFNILVFENSFYLVLGLYANLLRIVGFDAFKSRLDLCHFGESSSLGSVSLNAYITIFVDWFIAGHRRTSLVFETDPFRLWLMILWTRNGWFTCSYSCCFLTRSGSVFICGCQIDGNIVLLLNWLFLLKVHFVCCVQYNLPILLLFIAHIPTYHLINTAQRQINIPRKLLNYKLKNKQRALLAKPENTKDLVQRFSEFLMKN